MTDADFSAQHYLFERMARAVLACPVPLLGAINGAAFAGGLEIALCCDFAYASETARFALTEVTLGIMPGAGGTQRLPRLVGEARAKELIMLGRRIGAARAKDIGLVTDVVPPGQLRASVDKLLADLALCAPLSVASAKSAIERGHGRSLEEGLAIERECYEVTLFSEDRDEGLAAFAEGRPPKYLGR